MFLIYLDRHQHGRPLGVRNMSHMVPHELVTCPTFCLFASSNMRKNPWEELWWSNHQCWEWQHWQHTLTSITFNFILHCLGCRKSRCRRNTDNTWTYISLRLLCPIQHLPSWTHTRKCTLMFYFSFHFVLSLVYGGGRTSGLHVCISQTGRMYGGWLRGLEGSK